MGGDGVERAGHSGQLVSAKMKTVSLQHSACQMWSCRLPPALMHQLNLCVCVHWAASVCIQSLAQVCGATAQLVLCAGKCAICFCFKLKEAVLQPRRRVRTNLGVAFISEHNMWLSVI